MCAWVLPPFLPLIVEGETLYSWVAQYHRLSGNAYASQSSDQLFGDRRAGLRHDLPVHLEHLAAVTREMIGDAETLAYDRTLFGYFAPFQDTEATAKILDLMRNDGAAMIKSALGLAASRLGGFFPLKACEDCIREDLEKYFVSKWYLEHQWPSVWVCRKHDKLLWALKRELQPRELRQWLMPDDISGDRVIMPDILPSSMPTLKRLVEFSSYLAQLRCKHFDNQLLRYTYLLGAKEQGWLYTDGSVKLHDIREAFVGHYEGVRQIPGFSIIEGTKATHGGMIGLLMRQFGRHRHPVKHILLMATLFDNPVVFDSTYERIARVYNDGGIEALRDLVGESRRDEVLRLLKAGRKSMTVVSAETGIPLVSVVRIAKREGITYKQRSRVFNTGLWSEIRGMLELGCAREEIIEKTGIKRSLLKDLMARDPELREAWRKKDFERRRKTYRESFLELKGQRQGYTLKQLRAIPGNGVSWLDRNDREWLVRNALGN